MKLYFYWTNYNLGASHHMIKIFDYYGIPWCYKMMDLKAIINGVEISPDYKKIDHDLFIITDGKTGDPVDVKGIV